MKSVLPFKIVIPLVLGIVASLAIAVYAEFGFRRLEVANREMAVALEMDATLHETLALIVDAETGQRGYLLTGKEEYLQPYIAALPKIDDALHRLRELLVVHGTVGQRDALGRVNSLVGKKVVRARNDHRPVPERRRRDGAGADGHRHRPADDGRDPRRRSGHDRHASPAVRRRHPTVGRRRRLRPPRHADHDHVHGRAPHDRLAALPSRLRAARGAPPQRACEDKKRLEALVEERTAALSELSNHLQVVREEEKSKLARDLHDELGGILVSAKMDVDWVEQRLKERDPDAAAKLERAQQALDDGVQIKRRIIEELRPTLLDNLGLSAALDWQVHEICNAARSDVHDRHAGRRSVDPSADVHRALPDPAGGPHQHRQIRARQECPRRPGA